MEEYGLATDLAEKLRRLFELREQRDIDKATAERSETEYREYENEVYEALALSDIEGDIKVKISDEIGTVRFGPRQTIFARINDKEAVIDYFEEQGIAEQFTEPKLAKARLNELVREALDNEQELPPGLDWYSNDRVAITRQKNK